jgi:hypothetical protein
MIKEQFEKHGIEDGNTISDADKERMCSVSYPGKRLRK